MNEDLVSEARALAAAEHWIRHGPEMDSYTSPAGLRATTLLADLAAALSDALEDRAALIHVAKASQALVDDEESQEGGWGPDITMLGPLIEALTALPERVQEEIER